MGVGGTPGLFWVLLTGPGYIRGEMLEGLLRSRLKSAHDELAQVFDRYPPLLPCRSYDWNHLRLRTVYARNCIQIAFSGNNLRRSMSSQSP